MSPQVDPKNTSKRQERDGGYLPDLSGLLPRRLYLREFVVVLIVGFVGLVIYDFTAFVSNHSRYQADVVIRGVDTLTSQQVIDRLSTINGQEDVGALTGISVTSVKEDARESIPRLQDVTVRKQYPDQLVILAAERKPVVLVARSAEGDRQIYLPAGREGRLFRPTRKEVETLPEQVPVVRGFETLSPGSSEFERRWKQVRQFLEAVESTDTMDRFEWIKVRTGGFLEAGIERPKTLRIRFGQGAYAEKLIRFIEMMQTEQFMTIEEYVNLSDLDNVRVL
jgi:cell division septal protein FtsQ